MARQPIFDRQVQVYAYELLFRGGPDGGFGDPDPNKATARVIVDGLLTLGLPEITGDHPAFINLTREFLVQDLAMLLPPDQVVIEVLETVTPDREVIDACRRLKEAGFRLALDDFTPNPDRDPLVALADILKVDVQSMDRAQWRELPRRYRSHDIQMLAEKVETQQDFQEAGEAGYTLFQGYFFAKPAIVQARGVPESQFSCFQLLAEAAKPDPDHLVLDRIIRGDVSLSYKLLRYINSPHFGLRRPVTSIRDSLSRLGDREIRHWASLLALAATGADKPSALVQEAATRARFCELLATAARRPRTAETMFLVGLFSLMDALLDRPLADILQEISLPDEVKDALLDAPGDLATILACAVAYLRGEWEQFSARAASLGVIEAEVPSLLRQALAWTREALAPDDLENAA
jgi:c-di-GMP-related signal transduction protein